MIDGVRSKDALPHSLVSQSKLNNSIQMSESNNSDSNTESSFDLIDDFENDQSRFFFLRFLLLLPPANPLRLTRAWRVAAIRCHPLRQCAFQSEDNFHIKLVFVCCYCQPRNNLAY